MAGQTTHVGLVKPTGPESLDIDILNGNYDKLDAELFRRGTTVNGVLPDDSGDYKIDEVQFARQIVTNDAQQGSGEYLFRTTGGSASIATGAAQLVAIRGRSVHTGKTGESLVMTVSGNAITAEIDRDTFVAYVGSSGTITLTYTDAWSANPSLYGVTVSGTPVSGDQIVIVYVKESRGTITVSSPTRFASTGWNLYNHTAGYARVKKYSEDYGFLVGGTYTSVKFSSTLTGTKTNITPVSGAFDVPGDGYVWVNGGNSTNTYVLMTWSNWTEGYPGSFAVYSESSINLSAVMENFPYGLMQVAGVYDEIDLSKGYAVSRIERMGYTDANLEEAEATGRPYDCDTNYIYLVRETEERYSISVSGTFTANDHGNEIVYANNDVPVYVQTLYGQNLVDKLRTDVVTKSSDIVDGLTSDDATKALSAKQGKALKTAVDGKVNNYGNNANSPELNLIKINNTGSTVDVIAFGAGQERNSSGNNGGIMYTHGGRQYTFRTKGNNTANANEDFSLPAHSGGTTDKAYDILTTKDFPFTRLSGTATGGTLTFTGYELRHALVCFASEMVHLFCADASNNNVYTSGYDFGTGQVWSLTKSGLTYTLTRTNGNNFQYSILWI